MSALVFPKEEKKSKSVSHWIYLIVGTLAKPCSPTFGIWNQHLS